MSALFAPMAIGNPFPFPVFFQFHPCSGNDNAKILVSLRTKEFEVFVAACGLRVLDVNATGLIIKLGPFLVLNVAKCRVVALVQPSAEAFIAGRRG